MDKKEILYIVPSRGRPGKVRDLISSWVATRSVADLLIVVDNDDPTADEYRMLEENSQGLPWLHFVYGERLRLGPTLNKWALGYCVAYHNIGFMGDDHRPRTPIFDGLMASQLRRMRGGIVYPNDLYQGENLPTSVLMSSWIIETIGFMCPPGVTHMYLDNFWRDLGREMGFLRYMSGITVEHLHPSAGKAEMDEQYAEVNSDDQFKRDLLAYNKWLEDGGMKNAVEKLKATVMT